jgi:hypothetical protein
MDEWPSPSGMDAGMLFPPYMGAGCQWPPAFTPPTPPDSPLDAQDDKEDAMDDEDASSDTHTVTNHAPEDDDRSDSDETMSPASSQEPDLVLEETSENQSEDEPTPTWGTLPLGALSPTPVEPSADDWEKVMALANRYTKPHPWRTSSDFFATPSPAPEEMDDPEPEDTPQFLPEIIVSSPTSSRPASLAASSAHDPPSTSAFSLPGMPDSYAFSMMGGQPPATTFTGSAIEAPMSKYTFGVMPGQNKASTSASPSDVGTMRNFSLSAMPGQPQATSYGLPASATMPNRYTSTMTHAVQSVTDDVRSRFGLAPTTPTMPDQYNLFMPDRPATSTFAGLQASRPNPALIDLYASANASRPPLIDLYAGTQASRPSPPPMMPPVTSCRVSNQYGSQSSACYQDLLPPSGSSAPNPESHNSYASQPTAQTLASSHGFAASRPNLPPLSNHGLFNSYMSQNNTGRPQSSQPAAPGPTASRPGQPSNSGFSDSRGISTSPFLSVLTAGPSRSTHTGSSTTAPTQSLVSKCSCGTCATRQNTQSTRPAQSNASAGPSTNLSLGRPTQDQASAQNRDDVFHRVNIEHQADILHRANMQRQANTQQQANPQNQANVQNHINKGTAQAQQQKFAARIGEEMGMYVPVMPLLRGPLDHQLEKALQQMKELKISTTPATPTHASATRPTQQPVGARAPVNAPAPAPAPAPPRTEADVCNQTAEVLQKWGQDLDKLRRDVMCSRDLLKAQMILCEQFLERSEKTPKDLVNAADQLRAQARAPNA